MPISDHLDEDDAANMLDDLGELVTYVKHSVDPAERRQIYAIVHRKPSRFDRETSGGGARTPRIRPIRIVIANDALTGISAAEMDQGLDRIELETISGNPATLKELKLQTPDENERTQHDARFHTFNLY